MLNLLKTRIEISRLVCQWQSWGKVIAKAAEEVLGVCQVYVFGSVIEGYTTGGSDVDILIIAEHLPENFKERGNLKARIEEAAKLPLYHPFEIHLTTKEEAEVNPIYREAKKGVPFHLHKTCEGKS